MSVRMLPVACAATHGAHMAGCMSGSHARRHTSSHMSGCMTELHARHHTSSGCTHGWPHAPVAWRRHLVLLHPVSSRFRSHASGHLVLLGPFIRF
ncbi:BnaA05g16140D [Brassica napus]|uniref:BnaA05g16140D protein n=1 Tax=Brassica napus TaxID=3708 RepID=A0A078GW45_BRANA|nr:BnaA05g16140D [Brassica napus]